MQGLIKEGFQGLTDPYADAVRTYIEQGKYDLVNHFDNEVIMPSLWDSVLEPGMTVRMLLYQLPPVMLSRLQHQNDPQHTRTLLQYRSKAPKKSTAPSSDIQVHRTGDKKIPGDQDEERKREKHSANDDDTTPTVSTGPAPKSKASSLTADAARSAGKESSNVGQSGTLASGSDKQRTQKANISGSQIHGAVTRFEAEASHSPRSDHHDFVQPPPSSFSQMEDPRVDKKVRRSAARFTDGRTAVYSIVPTSYVESGYDRVETTGSSYPDSRSSYTNRLVVSARNGSEPVPGHSLQHIQPAVATRPTGQSSIQSQHLDYAKAYLELKQMFLDEKESVAKKLEDEQRARAENEIFLAKQIAAAAAAATANVKSKFAGSEVDKVPKDLDEVEVETKARAVSVKAGSEPSEQGVDEPAVNSQEVKAEQKAWALPTDTISELGGNLVGRVAADPDKGKEETKRSAAAAAAAASPKPVRLKDCVGRTFILPYKLCSTWQVYFSGSKVAYS